MQPPQDCQGDLLRGPLARPQQTNDSCDRQASVPAMLHPDKPCRRLGREMRQRIGDRSSPGGRGSGGGSHQHHPNADDERRRGDRRARAGRAGRGAAPGGAGGWHGHGDSKRRPAPLLSATGEAARRPSRQERASVARAAQLARMAGRHQRPVSGRQGWRRGGSAACVARPGPLPPRTRDRRGGGSEYAHPPKFYVGPIGLLRMRIYSLYYSPARVLAHAIPGSWTV